MFVIYTVGAYISVLIHWNSSEYPIYVYLTHWTYFLLIIYFIVSSVTTFYCHCIEIRVVTSDDSDLHSIIVSSNGKDKQTYNSIEDDKDGNPSDVKSEDVEEEINSERKDDDALPWYFKITWLLGNIVHNASIIVTVIYFTSIFPNNKETRGNLFNDLNLHAVNSLFVILDAVIIARPVKLLHFIYPEIFGVTYVLCNIIFWSLDKKKNVVYSLLDWNKPPTAASTVLGLVLVVVPLLQLLFFGIYRLRLAVYKCIYGKDY